jgi:hypothetical protein
MVAPRTSESSVFATGLTTISTQPIRWDAVDSELTIAYGEKLARGKRRQRLSNATTCLSRLLS